MNRLLTLGRHRFTIAPTGDTAKHTGRPRYRVYCETCGGPVHIATVDPDQWAMSHYSHEHDPNVMRAQDGLWVTRDRPFTRKEPKDTEPEETGPGNESEDV